MMVETNTPEPARPSAPGYYPVRPSSGIATAALVFGIIGAFGGWCLAGLPCVLAIVFGHQGLRETRTGQLDGHGRAVAGLWLGYGFVVPWAVLAIMFLVSGAATLGQ